MTWDPIKVCTGVEGFYSYFVAARQEWKKFLKIKALRHVAHDLLYGLGDGSPP